MEINNINVEIVRKLRSTLKRAPVEELVRKAIEEDTQEFRNGSFNCDEFMSRHVDLKDHVELIRIYVDAKSPLKLRQIPYENGTSGEHDTKPKKDSCPTISTSKVFKFYVYELNEDGEEPEYMDDDEENDQSASSHHWILPSASFDGLWDSLIFGSDVQSRLMQYINSALLFSEKGVDANLISWNKVILLHGPPGTGKTSLCKALAQKATIRLGSRYLYGQLIEINSHSLFSKWFSESGKLVMKMFEKIHDLVQDPKSLVFLLIDEVESLAQCRQSAEAGNEPSDSIRAVNALLTQIDRIKRYSNVVILTTSNIVGSIDLAFVDRADLKIFIGPPPPEIIYGILSSSINELIRVGIIETPFTFPIPSTEEEQNAVPYIGKLWSISSLARGMSGRTLRKIPFLAHANFMNLADSNLDDFLNGVEKAVQMEMAEISALKRKPTHE